MTKLAKSYRNLHQYEEAMQLGQETLEIRIRILGEEHPDTLRSMRDLARSYGELRRYQKAVQLEEKVP